MVVKANAITVNKKEYEKLKEENARLKIMNQDMVEAIKLHCDQCKNEQGITDCNVTECIWHKFLAKAEGRGEGE